MYTNNVVSKVNLSFWILFFGFAIRGFFWGSWAILVPVIKYQVNDAYVNFGFNLSFITIGALISMVFYGFFVDRLGKWSLFLGLLLFGIAIFTISFIQSSFAMLVVMFFVGITSGALDVALNTGVASLENVTNSLYFNKIQAAFPIAAVIASPLVGVMLYYGIKLHAILFFLSILTVIIGLFSCKIPEYFWGQNEKRVKFDFLISKFLFIMGLLGACVYFVENAIQQWGAIYLEHNLHANSIVAGLGHPVFMLMLFFGRMTIDYYGQRITDKIVLVITGISATIGMLLIFMAESQVMALLGFAVVGFGTAASIPTIMSKVGRDVPAKFRGISIGMVTTVSYFGYLTSPIFVGGITTLINMRFVWLSLAVFSIIVLITVKTMPNLISASIDN